MLRTVTATRYVTPLREGGSLPAIVEADDDGLYVAKFRGAGQGPKALIAELIAGELARALGLKVPELVLIQIDARLGRAEPDPEIRDLLKASPGLNLALDFLPGAVTFDPVACPRPAAELASAIVWFDAYVTNVDRTARNANLLSWHGAPWLIDHGAALYVHHDWDDFLMKSRKPFVAIRDHVLLPWAEGIEEADAALRARVTRPLLESIVEGVPLDWLEGESAFPTVEQHRRAYVDYLLNRLQAAQVFVEEAVRARAQLV